MIVFEVKTSKGNEEMNTVNRKNRICLLAAILIVALSILSGCKQTNTDQSHTGAESKNGDICILYTSDIHCGVEENFGLVGVQQVRETLEAQGYNVLLVDNGDSVQGEAMGTLSNGETIAELLKAMKYDVMIPGNHDFDYGIDQFFKLVDEMGAPMISCNFTKNDELVFDPYIIKEVSGKRIAFVGVTTPETIRAEAKFFGKQSGDEIYGFMQDASGEALYKAVQKAVDDARAEGVDYVYLMAHLGMSSASEPWTYDDVISNVSGIDVVLDGHSHDTEQVVMKDKDGKDVVRSACGTKLEAVGYSIITAEEGIKDTNIWTWSNDKTAPELLGIQNNMNAEIKKADDALAETRNQVIAASDVNLTTYDPKEKDGKGEPIRMIRRAETNMGDFIADAYREELGTDICLINGGAIREDIKKGDITYGEVIDVQPFNNDLCIIEASGQQILDALEWGAKDVPSEFGGFLQVSGLTYEIDVNVKSGCQVDGDGKLKAVKGERRVKNVTIGVEVLDPEKKYLVGGADYLLVDDGDGNTAFDGAKIVQEKIMVDNHALIDFVQNKLGGRIGADYEDPYGQDRITIKQ